MTHDISLALPWIYFNGRRVRVRLRYVGGRRPFKRVTQKEHDISPFKRKALKDYSAVHRVWLWKFLLTVLDFPADRPLPGRDL